MVRFYTENSRPFFIWGSDPKKGSGFPPWSASTLQLVQVLKTICDLGHQ